MALLGKFIGALYQKVKSILPLGKGSDEKLESETVSSPEKINAATEAVPPEENESPNKEVVTQGLIGGIQEAHLIKDESGYIIEADGRRYPIFEFSKTFGINYNTLYNRIIKGWKIEDVLRNVRKVNRDYSKSPSIKAKLWEWNGEKHTIGEWAKIYGVKKAMMRIRLTQYGSPERNCDKLKAYNANRARKHEWNGESHTIREWAEIYHVPERTMAGRWHKHNSPERKHNPLFPAEAKVWEWNGERHTAAEWAKIVGKGESTVRHNLHRFGSPYCVPAPKKKRKNPEKIPSQCIARKYEWNGVSKTAAEWATEYGCSKNAMLKRFRENGSPEKKEPKPKGKYFTYNGETLTYKEWGEKFGVSSCCICKRIKTHSSPCPPSKPKETPPKKKVEAVKEKKQEVILETRQEESDDGRYWYDGKWKKLAEWAEITGLPISEVRWNFSEYGEPTEPKTEDDDIKYEGIVEDEESIDRILAECDAKPKPKKKAISEWLAEIQNMPDDDLPLKETLGLNRHFNSLSPKGSG